MWALSRTNKQILPPEVKNWTDLLPQQVKKKRTITISLVAITIILISIGTVSVYFCCTRHFTVIMDTGEQVVRSAAPFSVFPGIFCGFFSIVSIVYAIWNHFYKWERQNSDITDELKIDIMSTLSLEGAHYAYYCNLKGLLRHEIISYPEALEMKTILQEYQAISDVKKRYDRLSDNETQEVGNQWNDTYSPMLVTLADLRQRWQAFHERKFSPQKSG